jgi:stage II sporulation protein M
VLVNQTRRQYIRELWPHIAAVTVLLILGAIAGVLLAGHSSFARVKIGESLGGLSQLFLGFPKPLLALLIFANNAIKTLLVILLGMAFAIVPLAFVVVNGVAIGLVLQLSTQTRGVVNSLMAIVPHGVFELPGILLGAGIGFMLGVKAARRLFRRAEFKPRYELGRALRFFASTIVPLLLIGALTEAYLTALLVGK